MAIMVLSCGVMMAYSGKTKLKLLFNSKFTFILTVKNTIWHKVWFSLLINAIFGGQSYHYGLFGPDSPIFWTDDGPCCYAMNAKCLACSAGKTIEAYCAENQDATGCEARGNLLNQKFIRILFYCFDCLQIFCKTIEYIF